jgi:osmoprotectant transport system ATP-binding protein
MIELRHVVKKYGEFTAVDDLSFTVAEGEVCVLIGPSGCGKTSTLRVINRMYEPTSGEILIEGRNVRELVPELLRRRIGYVIQNVGLFPHMSVAENIAVVPRLLGWKRDRIEERVGELLELVGLPAGYRGKYPRELSGGEAQRVGVARSLAADPPILLMDEPFGAVDPLNRQILQGEFSRIQRRLRKTVVFVTHDLDEAVRLADRMVIMREGRLVQQGTPEEILARPTNAFVRSFVGAERALKRLSRYSVGEHMRSPHVLRLDGVRGRRGKELELQGLPRFVWVADERGRLVGWLNTRRVSPQMPIEEVIVEAPAAEIGVRTGYSLKEALSRILGQEMKSIPVLDEQDRIVGEIALSDIERVTEEGAEG